MGKQKAQTLQQRFGFADPELATPKHDEMMLWLDRHAASIVTDLLRPPAVWGNDEVHRILKGVEDALAIEIRKQRTLIEECEGRIEWRGTISADWAKEEVRRAGQKIEKAREVIARFEGRDAAQILGTPPERPAIRIKNKEWEYAITTQQAKGYGNKYVVGFIDMYVRYEVPFLTVNGLIWSDGGTLRGIAEDVIPTWEVEWHNHTPVLFEVKPAIPSLGELLRQIRMYQEYQGGTYVIVCPDDSAKEILGRQGVGLVKYDTEREEVYTNGRHPAPVHL